MQEILQFAKTKVPADWASRSLEERLAYWQSPIDDPSETRRTICAVEVWCECLGRNRKDLTQSETRKINSVLKHLPGCRFSNSADCGPYGRQRAFVNEALPKRWTRIANMSK
mgnify:FL=1